MFDPNYGAAMRRTLSLVACVGTLIAAGAVGGFIGSGGGAGAATSSPVGVVVLNPGRVLDTRETSKLPVGGSVVVSTGISGAAAAAVNITLTDTVGAGYVTAWDGIGAAPKASIINSSAAGETIANYAIVPVDSTGHFTLITSNSANLVVDLMGYLPSATAPVPTGLTATITGYNTPFSGSTYVSGTISNGGGAERSARVDVRCPNGSVSTDNVYSIAPGQTKGFEALCNGTFTSGATIQAVIDA